MKRPKQPNVAPNGRYYVYALSLSEDHDAVFYVGKGTGPRVRIHLNEAQSGHLCPKCAIIRHLLSKKERYWYLIDLETDDERYALWYEMKLITSFPYGSLCNLIGGQGSPVTYSVELTPKGWSGILWRDGEVIAQEYGATPKITEALLQSTYDHIAVSHYLPKILGKSSVEL